MNAKHSRCIHLIASVLVLVTSACSMPTLPFTSQPPAGSLPEGTEPGSATQVAGQEIEATAAPTRTIRPTETIFVPTLRPSSTPLPTSTSFVIPKLPVPPACNAARYVEDVTIPDGTDMPAGTRFTKTWKIKNIGTCDWDEDYFVEFQSGNDMDGNPHSINAFVESGETVDVSVNLTAPSENGHYRGYWILSNAKGKTFPSRFYVDIDVVAAETPAPDPRIRYDFAEFYCDATWIANEKILSCPNVSESSNGFALQVARPVLESGYIDNEKGLLTNPPYKTDGVIFGVYPGITIQNGDHFRSIVGCEHGAKNCSVRFELNYSLGDGTVHNLGRWSEAYDEEYTQVDINLSSLAGSTVNFYLVVYAAGASDNDRALWLRPRILKP